MVEELTDKRLQGLPHCTRCLQQRQLVVVELEVNDLELLQLWKKITNIKWIYGHSLHEHIYKSSSAYYDSIDGSLLPKESTVMAICKLNS